jgi:hypothetical protein
MYCSGANMCVRLKSVARWSDNRLGSIYPYNNDFPLSQVMFFVCAVYELVSFYPTQTKSSLVPGTVRLKEVSNEVTFTMTYTGG